MVETTVDIKLTDVTCILSLRLPIVTAPKSEVVLTSGTVNVADTEDNPMDLIEVGKYVLGIKKPRPLKTLPACKTQKVSVRRKWKSNRLDLEVMESGIRGFTKYNGGPIR